LVGAVHKLVDQYKCPRRKVLAERAAGRQRDQVRHAGALEDVDIGPVVDIGRRKTVALIVTRQENDRQPTDIADAQCAGWLTPQVLLVLASAVAKSRHVT